MSSRPQEGVAQPPLSDEDDVEGHGMQPREGFGSSPEEVFGQAPKEGFLARATGDEDDVEGHGFNVSSRTKGE
jgi:hypothetical protein